MIAIITFFLVIITFFW